MTKIFNGKNDKGCGNLDNNKEIKLNKIKNPERS